MNSYFRLLVRFDCSIEIKPCCKILISQFLLINQLHPRCIWFYRFCRSWPKRRTVPVLFACCYIVPAHGNVVNLRPCRSRTGPAQQQVVDCRSFIFAKPEYFRCTNCEGHCRYGVLKSAANGFSFKECILTRSVRCICSCLIILFCL